MTYLESYIWMIDGRREFNIRWRVRVGSREIDENLELESGVYSAFYSADVACPTCHGAVVDWKGRAAGCAMSSVLRLGSTCDDRPGGDIMTEAIGRIHMSGVATEQAGTYSPSTRTGDVSTVKHTSRTVLMLMYTAAYCYMLMV